MSRPLPQGFFSIGDAIEYGKLIKSLPDGSTMVECGVWLGRSLASVANIILRKRIKVIAVDMGVKKQAMGHPPPPGGQKATFLRHMHERGIYPKCYWMSSLEAAKRIDPVEFVFLDDDHEYEYVREEIAAWLPKTKLLMGGHDYLPHPFPRIGVKQAVDETFKDVRVRSRVWSVRLA